MSSSLAHRPQPEFGLLVLNGQDRGAMFKLVGQRITIGRGSDNDIVIKEDVKMSRNHAIVAMTSKGVELADVSDRNKVLVNGHVVTRVLLSPGVIIQLGETKFQFKSLTAPATLEQVSPSSMATPRRSSRFKRGSSSSMNFYILVGVIALVFVWLLTSSPSKKEDVAIRTEEVINTEINDFKKIVDDAEAERTRLGTNTRQYEEAQPNFIKGFRDYRKGQYERALEAFQACLSLFPDHIQCKRYMNLAQKKFDELIQYHMVLANKYRAQNQFAACKASFRNAMVMIRNPSHKNYIEAKAGFDACDALEGDRY